MTKYVFIKVAMSYKNSVCQLRWGYPNISLTRSEIRTCCKTPFQTVNKSDIDQYGTNLFLNTQYQKERRLEMLKGIRHSDCKQCWQLEDQGAKSLRGNTHENFVSFATQRNMFDEFPNQTLDEISESVDINNLILESHRPFMLEVSLGNTCDMKCMYCNHIYSSQWATESLKNNRISLEVYENAATKPNQEFIDLFWKWVNEEAKHSLDRIGIIGGEPLITPEFYNFLDRLLVTYEDVPKNDTIIWVVTNMNATENYFNRFMEFIPKLKDKFVLEIHISMESLGDQAEYIRNGLNWERFEKNVNKLFEIASGNEKIELSFLPSISALSIPRYKEFLQWVFSLCMKHKKPAMLKQNIVTFPNCHTPFVLDNQFADYLDPAIDWMKSVQNEMPEFRDKFGRWDIYNEFLIDLRNSIRNNNKDYSNLKKEFYRWFSDFDNLRGLDFTKTFPELKNFYEQCRIVNE